MLSVSSYDNSSLRKMVSHSRIPLEIEFTATRIDHAPQLFQSCMEVVRGFEKGEKAKVSALLEIQALLAAANLSQESLAQSLALYLKLLDSIESKRKKAAEQGGNGDPNVAATSRKRTREEEEEGSDDGSETQGDGGPSRRKIDETVLPWLNRAFSSKVNLSESRESRPLDKKDSNSGDWQIVFASTLRHLPSSSLIEAMSLKSMGRVNTTSDFWSTLSDHYKVTRQSAIDFRSLVNTNSPISTRTAGILG
ncbi:hypothetical protein BT96DRAFT_1029532 [Gymnopus androsaceus JB14]|uniref:Uncharacterized protein n=1 Tax=Gymnopus androsaceus JB14 TaxID=1447944 RepID=A0A6A4ILM6_9AGAR|nr:hypothetical protein BT96DRAFT_1029532 [Gymnopus androsaceus JB14]